ncbi:OmpA family protein [Corallococcus sp. ZKHCc1 1396]|uniref:OmpA family protein n=1 Tax=Corallococcus soli TaxID=2710757 RepID=A0ABR9PY39_9BACT|nr:MULTISPECIES: OmpA family protein [Corallococcus]MBE4752824.1 OmpA family protein [Corallococcus soli]MCY1032433.1 OmpA family protein [Corallococcus sp. BB11-1]
MKLKALCLSMSLLVLPGVASAQSALDALKKSAGDAGKGAVEKRVNTKLMDEGRKNQCSFKSGTAELDAGCDAKLKKLAATLIDAKKQLDGAGVKSYKFEVSGHTDSSGDAAKNKKLSEQRAETLVKELVTRGVPRNEIIAVGFGSEKPLVKPDDTAAKKAKNRRYELRVRL